MVPKIEAVDPKRSAQMRLVRARDTKPELIVRRFLHAAGLRFRLHAKDLPGKPDIIFRRKRLAIFVHGCFWHQHPDSNCKRARLPKSRQDFWEAKLNGNRSRDEVVAAGLQQKGWRVINAAQLIKSGWTVETVWECQRKCSRP